MDTLAHKIKEFVSSGSFRKITFEHHCHGVRVTLYDNFHSITTDVEGTADAALDGALRSFPESIRLKNEALLDAANKEIEELNAKLRLERSKRDRLKAEILQKYPVKKSTRQKGKRNVK